MCFKNWQNVNVLSLILLSAVSLCAQTGAKAIVKSNAPAKPVTAPRSLTIMTEPKAIVWLNELRRGITDENGNLLILKVGAGAQKLRVRAAGFSEKTQTVPASARGEVQVILNKTSDVAELAFQQAESLRESGREADRPTAAEFYRQALKAKSNYLAARLGLARVLGEMGEIENALAEIAATRKLRPADAETSTVEGRIYRSNNDTDNAVKSFQRAVREAKNVQPEAHTGLALAYQDKNDLEKAAAEFNLAIAQLAETEPIIYQLLGETYEKMRRTKEAVAAYEKFLQLAPTNNQAPAVRSIIEQLKKQNSGDALEIMPQ